MRVKSIRPTFSHFCAGFKTHLVDWLFNSTKHMRKRHKAEEILVKYFWTSSDLFREIYFSKIFKNWSDPKHYSILLASQSCCFCEIFYSAGSLPCHTSKQKFEKKFARISFGSKNGGNQSKLTAFHLYLCSLTKI